MRLVGCGKATRSRLRLSIITTLDTDCEALSRVFPDASGVIYKFVNEGGLSFVIGYPILGICVVTRSVELGLRVGSGDGTPVGAAPVIEPSPGSFVASFKEKPAARAEARRGRLGPPPPPLF